MKRWQNSRFSRKLGLRLPLIQGPFGGGLSSVALVSAVSNSGGLGSFGAHHLNGTEIINIATQIRQSTSKPFALNLWIPFEGSDSLSVAPEDFNTQLKRMAPYFDELSAPLPDMPERFAPDYREQLEAVLEARPAVFSFVYGIPDSDTLQRCRERNIATLGAATTVDEARALASAGVDMIVASGFEAGGHRVSFLRPAEDSLTGGISLIPQIVDAVDVPVIAAGGIADGRGIAAALMLGAEGVQIGTAFLACEESGTSPLHREMLFSDAAANTQLTRVFSGRLARGIHNRLIAEGQQWPTLPYPAQNWLMGQLKRAATERADPQLMSLWSGQSAPLLEHHRGSDLIQALEQQVENAFSTA